MTIRLTGTDMTTTYKEGVHRWALILIALTLGVEAFVPTRIAAKVSFIFPVEFSADIVTTTKDKSTLPTLGKIYVSQGKIRVETNLDGTGVGKIVNFDKKEIWMIFYKVKTAQDWSADTAEFDPTPLIPKPSFYSTRPFDPESTCRMGTLSMPCKVLGTEYINGRDCKKALITDFVGGGPTTRWTMWVDLKLYYPIKVQSNGTTVELKNIQIGPQPDSVFEIPLNFKRTVFSMPRNLVAPPVKH